MTIAEVIKKNNKIIGFNISGHAFHAEYGKDIVCSAISMLCFTIANKLLDIEEGNVEVDTSDGKFNILIKKETNENQLLLETLMVGFLMLEEQYADFVQIKEVDYV